MAKQITQKLGFQAGGALKTLSNLTNRLNSASAALSNFKAQGGQIGGVANGINKVANATDKAAKSGNEFLLSWQTIGRVLQTQIMLRAINSVVQSLGDAVERARELGLRVAEIQTIGQGLNMTSADMTERIITASSEIAGVSAAQFAEGIYQTLSNQVVAVGDAFDFTREAAVLAKVTMVDTKDAVNTLSSVMNSYKMGAEQAAYVSDTLFATVEFGRLRLGDLANILGRVTPLAAELGIKWEEIAASTAVMTTQGTRADTALTQLRAVISALLKPSDNLRAIFERWGVRDAKAALAAFGGIGGVLKKLSKETGGSTAEMADLLKNVRAISGFFGTMTEEGNKLDDTLKKITDSTGKLENAWERFKVEGAQILSKEMETYNNTLTKIGTEGMPTVVAWYKVKNNLANNALALIRLMNGSYSEQGEFVSKIRNTMEKGNDALEAHKETLARINRKDWQAALQNVNLYYTEINKQEMNLQRIRENSIQTAGAVFQAAGKNITSVFEVAKKELEDVIKMAKNANKVAQKEIADIDQKIAGKRLEGRLEATPDAFKGRVLQEALSAQQRKVAEAFAKIDASKESKERALSEAQILENMAGQSLALAKQLGDSRAVAKARADELAALHQQKQIIALSAQEQSKILPDAQKKLAELDVEEAKLKDLMKQYTEKRMLLSDIADPDARKILEEEIASLKTKMEEIFKDVNLGMAFFESLGIGENLNLLSQELETALNKAEKDWEAEFQRAKEVFGREAIPLKIAADPTGLIERAASVFRMEQAPGQTITEFNTSVIERAKEIRKEYLDGEVKIKEEQGKINNAIDTAHGILHETQQTMLRIKQETIETNPLMARAFNDDTIKNYRNALLEAYKTVRGGGKLTEEQVFTLNELKNIAQAHNHPLKEQIDNYARLLQPIDQIRAKNEEIKRIQETTPTKEMNDAAWAATQAHEASSKALGEVNDKAGHARDEALRIGTTLGNQVVPNTVNVAIQTGNIVTQAQSAQEQFSNLGQNIGNAIPSLSNMVNLARQLAESMAASAQASAQVGSGGAVNQNYGGSMRYFAFGGRGQDKIPAMLRNKETVVNARNSQRFFSELNAMNQGSKPVYREQGGTVTNVGDINVTVQGGDSSQQTVREIGRALRREVHRGTIKLR